MMSTALLDRKYLNGSFESVKLCLFEICAPVIWGADRILNQIIF